MRMNWDRSIMIALCLWAAMEADCSMQNNPPVQKTNTESVSSSTYTQDEINTLYAKADEIWNHFDSGNWKDYDSPNPVLKLLAARLCEIEEWAEKNHRSGSASSRFGSANSDKFPSLEHFVNNPKDQAALIGILADRAERVLQSFEAAHIPPPPKFSGSRTFAERALQSQDAHASSPHGHSPAPVGYLPPPHRFFPPQQ